MEIIKAQRLILASNSPRRKFIMQNAGYKFDIVVSEFAERTSSDPVETAVNNAEGKALDVWNRLGDEKAAVLGADTVVFLEKRILGKPADAQDAKKMLRELSGKTHRVITAYAVAWAGGLKSGYSVSEVTFKGLSDKLIEDYVASGLPLDKAGAYGIQDGFPLVDTYTGSIDNIIGLPLSDVRKLLEEKLEK